MAFGPGARIEGWSTRPKDKERKREKERRRSGKSLHHIIIEEFLFYACDKSLTIFLIFPPLTFKNNSITPKPARSKAQQATQIPRNLQTNRFKIDSALGSEKTSKEAFNNIPRSREIPKFLW
jgi:hypothetical protein